MSFGLASPIDRNNEEQQKLRWPTFGVLLLLFVFSAIANIPHSRAVITLTEGADKLPPVIQSILSNAGISLILGSFFIWIGLWLRSGSNLGAPLVILGISRKSLFGLVDRKVILSSLWLGVIVGIIYIRIT